MPTRTCSRGVASLLWDALEKDEHPAFRLDTLLLPVILLAFAGLDSAEARPVHAEAQKAFESI